MKDKVLGKHLTNTSGYSSKYFSALYTDEFALRKEAEAYDTATFSVNLAHLTIWQMSHVNSRKLQQTLEQGHDGQQEILFFLIRLL